MNGVWKGVLIEESLTDVSVLPKLKITVTKVTTLEEEAEKGVFHFHNVEVEENNLDAVILFISRNIKDSWYFHLVKDGEMVVMFHNKVVKAHKGNTQEVEAIRKYALSQGILNEQLPLEKLFENPYL